MPIVKITLAPLQNTITVNGRVFAGRDRWACAFLSVLTAHHGRGVTTDVLNRTLAKLGQAHPLARAQVARLVAHARALFDGAVGDGAFDQRFVVQPRSVTVGPWAWRAVPGDDVQIVAPESMLRSDLFSGDDRPAPQPETNGAADAPNIVHLLDDARPSLLHAWLVALATADKFAMAGDHADAAAAFAKLLRDKNLTREGHVLVLLRQARSLKRCGDLAATRGVLRQVMALTDAARAGAASQVSSFPDSSARHMAEFMLLRVDYDEAPSRNFAHVADSLYRCEPRPLSMPYGVAEWHNLAGITFRRIANAARMKDNAAGLESGGSAEHSTAVEAAATRAWSHLCTAIYWALSFRDFDNVQNFMVNMGIHCAAMHNMGLKVGIEDAFAFYDLSLAYASNFACGEDTAWEHVVLGNLWLDYPDLRPRFETTPTLAGLSGRGGCRGKDAFFATIRDVALRKGDARQYALALECNFRYGEQQNRGSLQSEAVAELRRLFREHKLLRTELDRPDMPTIRRMLAWRARSAK
jgi:hypothetical protein